MSEWSSDEPRYCVVVQLLGDRRAWLRLGDGRWYLCSDRVDATALRCKEAADLRSWMSELLWNARVCVAAEGSSDLDCGPDERDPNALWRRAGRG